MTRPDADRFHKTLTLLLCTPEAGEAVAARDALVRMGQAQGFDAHDLACALCGVPPPRTNGHKPDDRTYVNEMAKDCLRLLNDRPLLSDKELGFVQAMAKWRKQPSAAQIEWLERLYKKVRGEP